MFLSRKILAPLCVSAVFLFSTISPSIVLAIDTPRVSSASVHRGASPRFLSQLITGAITTLVGQVSGITGQITQNIASLQGGIMNSVLGLIGPMQEQIQQQVGEFSGVFSQVSQLEGGISSLTNLQGIVPGLSNATSGSIDITQQLQGILPTIGAGAGQNVLGQITGIVEGVSGSFDITDINLNNIAGKLGDLTADIPSIDQITSLTEISDKLPDIQEVMGFSIQSVTDEIGFKDLSISNLESFKLGELTNLQSLANAGNLPAFINQADSYITSNTSQISILDNDIIQSNSILEGLEDQLADAITAQDVPLISSLRNQINLEEKALGTAQTMKNDLLSQNLQLSDLKDLANTEGLSTVFDSMPTIFSGIDTSQDFLGEGKNALLGLKGELTSKLNGLASQPLETIKDYLGGVTDLIPSFSSANVAGTGIGGAFGEVKSQLEGVIGNFQSIMPSFGSVSEGLGALGGLEGVLNDKLSFLQSGFGGQLSSAIGDLGSQLGPLQGQLQNLLGPLQSTFADFSTMATEYFGSTDILQNMAGVMNQGGISGIANGFLGSILGGVNNLGNLVPGVDEILQAAFGGFLRTLPADLKSLVRKQKMFKKVEFALGKCKKPLKAYKKARGAAAFKKKKKKFNNCKKKKSDKSGGPGGTQSQEQATLKFLASIDVEKEVGTTTEELYGYNFLTELERIESDMIDIYIYISQKYPHLVP